MVRRSRVAGQHAGLSTGILAVTDLTAISCCGALPSSYPDPVRVQLRRRPGPSWTPVDASCRLLYIDGADYEFTDRSSGENAWYND